MEAEIAKLMEGAQVQTRVQYRATFQCYEMSPSQTDINIYCCHGTAIDSRQPFWYLSLPGEIPRFVPHWSPTWGLCFLERGLKVADACRGMTPQGVCQFWTVTESINSSTEGCVCTILRNFYLSIHILFHFILLLTIQRHFSLH